VSTAPVIIVTSGEPAGIGPDICLALAARDFPARLAVLGDPALLAARAQVLGSTAALEVHSDVATLPAHRRGTLGVLPVALRAPAVAGTLDAANAAYVLDLLRSATALCRGGRAAALVTAPVQKSIVAAAGYAFSGHTEFLAELCGVELPVMLLAGKNVRVALATTHLPLRAVPDAIDRDLLMRIVRIVHADLRAKFGLAAPRIAVLGLNPHAGESGLLGTEDRDVIAPVVASLAREGLAVTGPVSADTAFTRDALAHCDVVVAMYHDQGLPALKAIAFGEVVNVTLGLPIVRTSVDHGTALALAGTGRARPASLFAAVELAIELASRA
jgi:4-hydroxythreonine-4-phosphate dehydrogenase